MAFEQDFLAKLTLPGASMEMLTLELFRHQAVHCKPYRDFLSYLKADVNHITRSAEIPFLPVRFFKTHSILMDGLLPEFCFTSSTTGGGLPSRHYVPHQEIYEWAFHQSFRHFYGNPADYCFLALLPSYLERDGSSLVYMADAFIKESRYPQSNFFLHDFEALARVLMQVEEAGIPTLLLGVTYALLDFAASHPMTLKHTMVMETGGMKGRKEEMGRAAVHELLSKAFHVPEIHSEYGMTELLSQAYSCGGGRFKAPPHLQVFITDLQDARQVMPHGKTGSVNLIDLANMDSCAFLATDDLGIKHADGSFEILGRKDHSDIRGCSLMYNP